MASPSTCTSWQSFARAAPMSLRRVTSSWSTRRATRSSRRCCAPPSMSSRWTSTWSCCATRARLSLRCRTR
eukprot:6869909-Prymnesium_polylepis.1